MSQRSHEQLTRYYGREPRRVKMVDDERERALRRKLMTRFIAEMHVDRVSWIRRLWRLVRQ